MKLKQYFFCALTFFALNAMADIVTEDFEDVTLTNADTWGRATELSNGWKIQGGYIGNSKDSNEYGFWSTAYNGSTKSLTAQYGSSNNAYVIVPVLLTGDVTFFYRKTSSDSRTAGKVYAYKVTENEGIYTVGSRVFMDESATSSWQKCTSIHLSEPTMIAFKMVRAAMDDVVYNTASLEPHEHNYAIEWSYDETEHWHACTSEVGICDEKKIDAAAHDGLLCSVCGYKTPGIETYPWTEDFESITSGIPAGWDNSEGTTTIASYKWNYYNSYSDGKSVRFDSYNNKSNITNVLATPLLFIPETGAYELRFKCKNPKGGNYQVKIAEYGSYERVVLFDNLTNIALWTEKSVSLAEYAGKVVKIYFCGTSNWGSGDAYLYLDDVTVKESITHKHNYSEAWSHNYTSHWHDCLSEVGDCQTPQADFGNHTFDANGICTVCGYDQPYMEDFENGIPVLWKNVGWEMANAPSYGNGTKMAYAGRYADGNTLTTPRLLAKAGDVIEIEALLPWNDETLTMEYSTDDGETWSVAFAETPVANNTLCTLSWTAPADGFYLLRFSGRYNYIDNVCGFKLAPMTRSTQSGYFGTVCLPMAAGIEGAKLYTVELSETGNWLVLSETETLEAGIPYIYQAEADAQIFSMNGTAVTSPTNTGLLKGIFKKTKALAGTYVMQTHNGEQAFYLVESGSEPVLAPFRAYLQLNGNKTPKIGWDSSDAETAIETILNNEECVTIYNLNGNQLDRLQKGINIVNGIRVLVK